MTTFFREMVQDILIWNYLGSEMDLSTRNIDLNCSFFINIKKINIFLKKTDWLQSELFYELSKIESKTSLLSLFVRSALH